MEKYFLKAAQLAPELSLLLGGEGWGGKALPKNVRWIGHVSSEMHNAVNCSARVVLNVNRDSMAHTGYSPPTRLFEAAGSGSCVITDLWDGADHFFVPEVEILTAGSGKEVAAHLRKMDEPNSKMRLHPCRHAVRLEREFGDNADIVSFKRAAYKESQ